MAQEPKNSTAAKAPAVTYEYLDRPEVSEVFADFVHRIQFDGQTLRFEFCVSRLEEQAPPAVPKGKRYPACRLVLSAAAAVDLMNKMQQITAGLIKAGVLKADAPKAPENLA
jgi:hypothetical protein